MEYCLFCSMPLRLDTMVGQDNGFQVRRDSREIVVVWYPIASAVCQFVLLVNVSRRSDLRIVELKRRNKKMSKHLQ